VPGALIDNLSARTLFVAGKGGVGKTTTASEIAARFSDRGESVHLISVDPAHSLRDVLGEGDRPHITIEEFDARSYADRWLAAARPALVEVAERGTYLDANDAGSFLDLSLPGVDEVMAALRLLELQESAANRIVVDTAPTGHFLRLLQANTLLENWANALEAMVQKASAVAIGMVGQSPQWAAISLLQQWREQARNFAELTSSAQFVIVTRADAVVQAETNRLIEYLRQDHKSVAAVITRTIPTTTKRATPASDRATPFPSPQAFDFKAPLLLVAGKGGVGKSTIAAAIAVMRAQTQQTCLISTDPAGSLADVLDTAIGSEPTEVHPRLRAWQLAADAEFERLRNQYAGEVHRVFEQLGLDQSINLDRAVIDRLWNLAPPGIDEIVALSELADASDRCPATILDSAPTGHFLRLMELPEASVQWTHALMRLLLKYHVAGALEEFTREIMDFAKRSRQLQQRLTTQGETAAVLVTLDEPVVWAETIRLHAALGRAKIPVAALVVNRADAGPLLAHSSFDSTMTVIRTPNLDTPPIGADALRAFVGRWEVLT
jgi:arsenite/tail-anchored protein-transporting ATPase